MDTQGDKAVVEAESPPISGCTSPELEEDLDSMSMDEVLRAY